MMTCTKYYIPQYSCTALCIVLLTLFNHDPLLTKTISDNKWIFLQFAKLRNSNR